jgi:malonate decarboxylase alpha subunit
VQTVETFQNGNTPVFVETLDAFEVAKQAKLDVAPVMIYGDDVTHVVTEEGVAYLYKAEGGEERRQALSAIAGVTPIGRSANHAVTQSLRERGIVAFPEDLGIARTEAKRTLLAAKNVSDLVDWSKGLYTPPAKFKNW